MYTPEELAAIREAERRNDMERDAEHQQQLNEYRKQREAEIETTRQQRNPDLAKRLAATREQMEQKP